MFVLKLEVLKLISVWLDRTIRRMIAEIQVSQLPRETLKLRQTGDNVFTIDNVPFAHLLSLHALVCEVRKQGLARDTEIDFIDTLDRQVQTALGNEYRYREEAAA